MNPYHPTVDRHATATMPTIVSPDELHEWLSRPDRPRLIDVRSAAEFTGLHIPTATNIPLDMLQEHRDELTRPLDEQVVLICRSGMRATNAQKLLSQSGLEHLHVLDGGTQAWESAGHEVVKGATVWDLERQVRLVAGGLVLLGILLSIVIPGAKWFSAAIGGGLMFAALTNSCMMGMMLAKLPWNRQGTPDVSTILRDLAQ